MASSSPTAVQAASAASFTSSVGINTHIDFTWTAYGNLNEVENALNYLDIKNVRDSPGSSSDLTWWQQVAQATGVKFDAFIGETSPAGYSAELSLMRQLAGLGLLNAVEGGNEPDQPYAASQGTSTSFAAQFQQQVWNLGQSLGLPVIQTSFGMVNDYGSTGNLSAYANYGNAHTYYGTGNNPGLPAYWNGTTYASGTMQWLNAEAQLTTPGKPVITTESGYYTTGSTTDPSSVSETVQAKYTLDILMDGFKDGDARTYLYELLDQKTGDGNPEDNFGLFHSNGTPKLAAVAVHDLMTLLADNGSTDFKPSSLSYSLSGLQSTDNSFLLEKSNGTYWLALWNDTRLSGPSSPSDLTVPPHTVTLTLGSAAANIDVFDPLIGTNAVASASNTNSVAISLPDHPILIEIAGSGVPAPTPAPTPTPSPTPAPTPTPTPSATGPLLTVPSAETVAAGATKVVTGVSITDAFAASNPGSMALNLSATAGTLQMTDISGAVVAGSGTHAISITGTLAQLNADLARLSYIAGGAIGSDSITVDVWDQAGMEGTKSIAVTISTPAPTPAPTPSPAPTPTGPSISAPASDNVSTASTSAMSGVSITDAFAASHPGTLALDLSAQSGTLRMTDASGNAIAGSGTHAISVDGTLAQLNADLATLSYTAGSSAGSDSVSVNVWDQAGIEGMKTISISVAAPTPIPPPTPTPSPAPTPTGPAIAAPATDSVSTGATAAISGVSITDAFAASNPGSMVVNLSAGSGTLSMTDANGNLLAGSGTHSMSVTGSLAQLNADLAHLSYVAGSSTGSDSVSVDVWDQAGLEAARTIAVSITAPATTGPSILLPESESVTAGSTTVVSGVALSDAYAASHPGIMALDISAGSGTLGVTGANVGTISGSGTHALSITGTLAQLSTDISHLTYTAGKSIGSDSLSISVWDQLGLESTKSLAVGITPAVTTSASVTPASSISAGTLLTIAPTTASETVSASNILVGATAGDHALLIGGSFDTVRAIGGTENVVNTGNNNQITTGAGNDQLSISGTQNVVNAGAGHNTIQDNGSYNRLVMPAAGSGYDEIYGNVLNNHDLLDFRTLLAATTWNGRSNLSSWLQVHAVNGTNAAISINPSGVSGSVSIGIATLHGAGGLTLNTLLQHALV